MCTPISQVGKPRLCEVPQLVRRVEKTTHCCLLFLTSMPASALPVPTRLTLFPVSLPLWKFQVFREIVWPQALAHVLEEKKNTKGGKTFALRVLTAVPKGNGEDHMSLEESWKALKGR